MAMVSVVYWQPHRRAYGSSRTAWSRDWQTSGAVLHLLHEPDELLQCFKHDDSTIKIVLALLLLLLLLLIDFVTECCYSAVEIDHVVISLAKCVSDGIIYLYL